MLKSLKYISFLFALVLVLASCTKDEELMNPAPTVGFQKALDISGDSNDDQGTGEGPSTLASGGGAPIVDDEDDENDDDGAGITDDEDEENDNDSSRIKK